MSKEEQVQTIVELFARLQRPGLKQAWRQLGLSRAQAGLLYLLSYHQNSSVKQVADFLGVSKSAVSQLADPLIDKKLIGREIDKTDRRIVRLSLSPEGSKLLKQMTKHKLSDLRSAVDTLNEREIDTLYRLLNKAVDSFESGSDG
jgi:DNA-binding MarR family transcriptional regulator